MKRCVRHPVALTGIPICSGMLPIIPRTTLLGCQSRLLCAIVPLHLPQIQARSESKAGQLIYPLS